MPTYYTEFMSALDFIDLPALALPGPCLGQDYSIRVFISGAYPLIFIGLVMLGFALKYAIALCVRRSSLALSPSQHVKAALLEVLPVVLFLVFCFTISTSFSVFSVLRCQDFTPDITTPRRTFLRADLSIECYTPEWQPSLALFPVFLVIWPIGMPLLFLGLLVACRRAIQRKTARTQLMQATSFLHQESPIPDSNPRPAAGSA